MVATVVLAFTLFVGTTLAAPSPVRISINGTVTTTRVHPSIVQLDYFSSGVWGQRCAGSIITNKAVVSAARCTYILLDPNYRPENRRIRAGADFRDRGGEIFNVQSVLNHPNFTISEIGLNSDICIIRLSSFLTFGSNIGFISIMPQDFVIPDNSPVVYAGWGTPRGYDFIADGLREARVFTINHDECARRYYDFDQSVVPDDMICAGILDVGIDCFEDFGGPVYYQNILAGITSYGPCQCGNPILPSIVNTKVASHSDWIVAYA